MKTVVAALALALVATAQKGWNGPYPSPRIPFLDTPPQIDGDLDEWKYRAFTDGVWDLLRVRQMPWYDPLNNRLTDHGNEPTPEEDLNARYYLAWDAKHLYFGAEVRDNVNDTEDPEHAPERWYFKDTVCWFIEAPRHGRSKNFGRGDNAFCFVIDAAKPAYGAWWRHGSPEKAYIEQPLVGQAVDYFIRIDPWNRGKGDFILEARVNAATTLGVSDPAWHAPRIGDEYGLQIVHTDPDGGDYGGHLIIYGRGDNDATWVTARLVGALPRPERGKK